MALLQLHIRFVPIYDNNNFKLYLLLSDKSYCNSNSNESCLALIRPPKNSSHLFNEFNSFLSDINNTPENIINSNYNDINELQTFSEFNDKSSLSLFHLSTCLLSKNIDDLDTLFSQQRLILIS